jgi:hypothetical protein
VVSWWGKLSAEPTETPILVSEDRRWLSSASASAGSCLLFSALLSGPIPAPAGSHPLDPLVLFIVVGVVDHPAEAGHLVLQEPLHSKLECLLSAGSPVAGPLQAHPHILPDNRDDLDVAAIRLEGRTDLRQGVFDLLLKHRGHSFRSCLHWIHLPPFL